MSLEVSQEEATPTKEVKKVKLTAKQRRFARWYSKLGSAGEAARRAGYEANGQNEYNQATRLLKIDNVRLEINRYENAQHEIWDNFSREQYQSEAIDRSFIEKNPTCRFRYFELVGRLHGFIKNEENNGNSLTLVQNVFNSLANSKALTQSDNKCYVNSPNDPSNTASILIESQAGNEWVGMGRQTPQTGGYDNVNPLPENIEILKSGSLPEIFNKNNSVSIQLDNFIQ